MHAFYFILSMQIVASLDSNMLQTFTSDVPGQYMLGLRHQTIIQMFVWLIQ